MQELLADAVVETDAAGHFLDVGADLFGEIDDLVDEVDLGRKKGIRGVFGQLRRATVGVEDRQRVEMQRPLDLRDHLARPRIIDADHDPVEVLEVTNSRGNPVDCFA